jgi:hypothetical protein
MRNQKVHVLTIILGLVIAAAIMCAHVLQLDRTATSKQQVKTEKTQEESEKNYSYVSAPTITPPSSAQVHSNFLAHCLFEIAKPECEEQTFISDFNFHPKKFLLTLFRVIIAPNAP